MNEREEFIELTDTSFVNAKQMLVIVVIIELIIQSFALIIQPTAWWTWQLLGFIVATNLGAVILAIMAQRSADKISSVYKNIFTPDFYYTVHSLSKFRGLIEEQAEQDGKTLDEEMHELAPKFYGLLRKYVDVKAEEMGVTPPTVEVLPPPEHDAKLFKED